MSYKSGLTLDVQECRYAPTSQEISKRVPGAFDHTIFRASVELVHLVMGERAKPCDSGKATGAGLSESDDPGIIIVSGTD